MDIRYGKLKTDHDALAVKDAESQKLIEELQKATKGQDAVQAKITEYEATIARQQEELQQAKTEAALKVGLLSDGAKATDIDYQIFKLNHDSDWKPELGEDGQIKGFKDKMESRKRSARTSLRQLPVMVMTDTNAWMMESFRVAMIQKIL